MQRPGPHHAALVLLALLTAPAPGQEAAPTRAEVNRLLLRIDAAFNAQDLDAFLGHFQQTHDTLAAQMEARMKLVMSFGASLSRTSKLVSFKERGRRAVALIRSATSCAKLPDLEHVEHSYLVLRPTAAGPKGQFMVTVNEHALRMVQRNSFSCPACNYHFGGSDGWLPVPARPDQTGCMESVTFINFEHDLLVESSVHVLKEPVPARQALADFLAAMRTQAWATVDDSTPVLAWVPPAYQNGRRPPKHLQGAQCDVPLEAGRSAQIRLATFGPIRYLMVAHGKSKLLAQQADTIKELLRGFRLLADDKAPSEVCRKAMQAHTGGGSVVGNTYQNRTHNVRLEAPTGWHGDAYASQYLFRVRFQNEDHSGKLSLQAMAPPVGFTIWTVGRANHLFLRSCAGQGLDSDTDTGWRGTVAGFQWREVCNRSPEAQRILRLAMRDSILVVMEGEARDQPTLGDIRKAMDSLALLK
ncbi:MAG: hypothetical protein ACYTFN_05900 [Planctomycetota bacterium]|jgi:hypothetical protein